MDVYACALWIRSYLTWYINEWTWSSSVICCFTSQQRLRSYQDGHWLVTVCTHGDFIVLPHWHTSCHHHDLISWHWANQSLPFPNNDQHLARKQQVFILKSFDQGSNLWGSDSPISHIGLVIRPSHLGTWSSKRGGMAEGWRVSRILS